MVQFSYLFVDCFLEFCSDGLENTDAGLHALSRPFLSFSFGFILSVYARTPIFTCPPCHIATLPKIHCTLVSLMFALSLDHSCYCSHSLIILHDLEDYTTVQRAAAGAAGRRTLPVH